MRTLDAKLIGAFCVCAVSAMAISPTPLVKTVPWSPTNPLIPHDSVSGRQITLKGTCDRSGTKIIYTWDFGDGSAPVSGQVTDPYAIEAKHVYTGSVGTIYTARLTVEDQNTGKTDSKAYFVILQDVSTRENKLKTDVNIAIDEGLWYLHKSMNRFDSGGIPVGDWRTSRYGGYAYDGYISCSAANVNAFEVNGHLEIGSSDNPYTETVRRGLRRLFQYLETSTVPQQTNPHCTFMPDGNGNGYKIELSQDQDW
ncbi:MAG TPA: PKD domain-containing protein, partial [Candidatus Paceibacterota bacterium]|nr:PKD domain-containing protein [Candidatus Paceibacterota bacterium]